MGWMWEMRKRELIKDGFYFSGLNKQMGTGAIYCNEEDCD